jgi:hypothetical protein
MLQSLEKSDSLCVFFSDLTSNDKKEIKVQDKICIKKLFERLSSQTFVSFPNKGKLSTSDWIEIIGFEKGKTMCHFWVLASDLVQIEEKRSFYRFKCSDRNLSENIRKELNLKENIKK